MTLRTSFALVLAIAASACGDDGGGGDTTVDAALGSRCAQIAAKACQLACDCDPAAECITTYGNGVVTAKYDDAAHCNTFETYVCGMGQTSDAQQTSCFDALATAQCIQVTHDGTPYSALQIPMTVCTDVL